MGGVKESSIIHGKLMALNHGNENDNYKINDQEKRFMGFFLNISFMGFSLNSCW